MRVDFHSVAAMIAVLGLGACASMPGREPVQVTVSNVESIPGEGLEARMMVKLRVQNPNDSAVDYDGVSVKLDVLDKTFATGVSDAKGSVPRFGETLIEVPVTASALRIASHALTFLLDDKPIEKVHYKLTGRLGGPMFGSVRFEADGELALPK